MRYLTIAEAAESLQLSVPTIKRYIYSGKLKSTKLPGGQHRIPETEIERLLADTVGTEQATSADADPCAHTEQRVAVLERWVTELEADVERLTAALEVVSRFCARRDERPQTSLPAPEPGHPRRLAVLGTGCKRCDALFDLATRVVRAGGREDVQVVRVHDLDDIAAHGPVLTPALALDDRVILSGRVPPEAALRDLLERELGRA